MIHHPIVSPSKVVVVVAVHGNTSTSMEHTNIWNRQTDNKDSTINTHSSIHHLWPHNAQQEQLHQQQRWTTEWIYPPVASIHTPFLSSGLVFSCTSPSNKRNGWNSTSFFLGTPASLCYVWYIVRYAGGTIKVLAHGTDLPGSSHVWSLAWWQSKPHLNPLWLLSPLDRLKQCQGISSVKGLAVSWV